jgi:hypothetical protein
MTMTEVVHHAGTGSVLEGVTIAVIGEVTAMDDDRATLSRWAPGCCADTPVDVQVESLDGATLGSWWSVVGRWFPGTGASFSAPPRLSVLTAEPVAEPPPRREAG